MNATESREPEGADLLRSDCQKAAASATQSGLARADRSASSVGTSCSIEEGNQLADDPHRGAEENRGHALEPGAPIAWTADPDGNVLEVGEQWFELIGTSREQALGLGTADAVHPEDVEQVKRRWSQAIETGEPLDATIRLRLKEGTYQWFRTRAAAQRNPSGKIVRWYGIIENIHAQVTAQLRLQESEENYRNTIELSPQIPWVADAEGNIVEVGPRWLEFMGMTHAETLGQGWTDALHPNDRDAAFADWSRSIATGEPADMRYRLRLKDGTYNWFRARAAARRDSDGTIRRWYGLAENIEEQVAAELALAQRQAELLRSEERSRLVARATNDLLWDWDLESDLLIWNEVLVTSFGYSDGELRSLGAQWKEWVHPADRERVFGDLAALFQGSGDQYSGEYRFRRADGSYAYIYNRGYVVRDREGKPTRMVGAMQDLSERKHALEQLRWNATHDALTGLPNRVLFRERLAKAIRSASRRGGNVGVLELDIDHFKQVNDTLGHDAGDAMLKAFAERLQSAVRHTDTVARLGGDELAIILPGLTDSLEITKVVESIQGRLLEPFIYGGRVLTCRASIGASVYPQHGYSPEELLQNADIALYNAKFSGRGRLTVFHPEQREHLQQQSSMISLARGAVADGRLMPFYQPKVELSTGKVAGFEALLRWRDDREALQLPAAIAAAFDDLETATAISDHVVAKAIEDIRSWLDRGIEFGHVAINASAAEFQYDHFAERVLERLHEAGIPPKHFQVEVTESVFLGRSADYVKRALKLLSSEGLTIALDDFGTGYASLRHLKEFPVDLIKIDRSFVSDMQDDPSDAAIVRAVINLGQSLGIKTVAEGVETAAQEALLCDLGCEYAQGFLYSRAVPGERVPNLIRSIGQAG